MRTIGLLFLIVLFGQANAAGKCRDAEIQEVEQRLNGVTDILILHGVFGEIRKCGAMDGAISEGFYDVANRLLAEHFDDVASSSALSDRAFKSAILKSISDGTEVKTFQQISRNANACSRPFCKEVQAACKKAEQSAKKIENH